MASGIPLNSDLLKFGSLIIKKYLEMKHSFSSVLSLGTIILVTDFFVLKKKTQLPTFIIIVCNFIRRNAGCKPSELPSFLYLIRSNCGF